MKLELEYTRAFALLPARICEAAAEAAGSLEANDRLSELRLRIDRPASLTVNGENRFLPISCTAAELKGAVLALSGGSPYAYSDCIRKGYIPLENGLRLGVCPSASAGGSLDGITSICLRFPFVGKPKQPLDELVLDSGRVVSTMFYSPPGVGKTTVLRQLAAKLSGRERALRCVVVDSRGELYMKKFASGTLCEYIFGYEKGEGIELAARSLSPEVIICDEIGSASDADAVIAAQNTGIPIIASAHADSFASLMRRPHLKRMFDAAIFERYIGIRRDYASDCYEFERASYDSRI